MSCAGTMRSLDAVREALIAAAIQWPREGLPDNRSGEKPLLEVVGEVHNECQLEFHCVPNYSGV